MSAINNLKYPELVKKLRGSLKD